MTASSDTPDPAAFVIAIPARLAAARLPEKPLRLLGAEPLIRHVARRAMQAGAVDVAVAADDARILEAVADLPVRGVLTGRGHASGTDRLAECARLCGWPEDTIIVNLQGDEPFAPAAGIRAVAQALVASGAEMATLATPITELDEVFNSNVVKVVTTTSSTGNGRVRDALYFSRAPIPWDREHFAGDEPTLKADTCLRHIGIYAYRNAFLQRLAATPQGVLERIESLEQLRALEAGHRINVALTPEAFPPGVDTPEDLARAEQFLTSFTSQNA